MSQMEEHDKTPEKEVKKKKKWREAVYQIQIESTGFKDAH